jgi:hypothetical protein
MTRIVASGSAISKVTPRKYLYLKQILGIKDKISVIKIVLYNRSDSSGFPTRYNTMKRERNVNHLGTESQKHRNMNHTN